MPFYWKTKQHIFRIWFKEKDGGWWCATMVNSLRCSINIGGNRAVLVLCAILSVLQRREALTFSGRAVVQMPEYLKRQTAPTRRPSTSTLYFILIYHSVREVRFPSSLNHFPTAANDLNGLIKWQLKKNTYWQKLLHPIKMGVPTKIQASLIPVPPLAA